jgi:hypothetical protein
VIRDRPLFLLENLTSPTEFPLPVRVMLQAWKMPVKQFVENGEPEAVRKGLMNSVDHPASCDDFDR